MSAFPKGRSMDPECQALVFLAKERGPDSVLTYAEISKIVGEPHQSDRFRSVISRARNDILKETGFCIKNVQNVGYRILTAKEQVVEGVRKAGTAVKVVKKGAKIVVAADRSKLTAAGRVSADFLATRLVDIHNGLRVQLTPLVKVARTEQPPWPRTDTAEFAIQRMA